MRRLTRRLVVAALALAACARILPPPGGPADDVPPLVIAVKPDTLVVAPDFDDDVEFIFDEIVSEGTSPNFGTGTGSLETLVILSPTTRIPEVRWRRSRITVKPREGWKPNTVYRVELLRGLEDLRRNRSTVGRVVTFTTGAPPPTRTLRGRVVDWTTARPQPNGTVEALLLPDSLSYRTVADSSGRFVLGPLPEGEYLVTGGIDQNRNRRRDGRESFDSVRVRPGQDSVGELWAFRHDTVPPRIASATRNDSMSISITFNQDLNPYVRLPADSVRVRTLPDSTLVPVEAVLPVAAYDSVYVTKRDTTTRDSTRPADTTTRRPPPRQTGRGVTVDTTDRGPLKSRPPLFDRLIIRLRQPVEYGGRYRIEVSGAENVSRVAGPSVFVFAVPPKPPAPDSAARDSTPPDTGRRVGGPKKRSAGFLQRLFR